MSYSFNQLAHIAAHLLQKNKFKEGTTIIFKRVLQQVSA